MASDRDLVSSEDHEINYLLRKWNKKQSNNNREILVGKLKEFKKDPDFKPHNRENFYKYVDLKNIKDLLEDKTDEIDETPIGATVVGNSSEETSTTIIKEPSSTATIVGDDTKTGSDKVEKKGLAWIIILIIAIILVILILIGILIFFNKCSKENKINKDEITRDEIIIEKDNEEKIGKKEVIEKDPQIELLTKLKDVIKDNIPIYFVKNKAVLLDGEKEKLDNILTILNEIDKVELLIEGHTASVGLPEREMALSKKRASYVMNYLKLNSTNKNITIKIIGHGSKKEAIKNPSQSEKQKNRRIEIQVVE